MKMNLLALIVGTLHAVRARTLDVAFTYRMGAGFPGTVNRAHPFSAVAGLLGATAIAQYGYPARIDAANGYIGFTAGDTAVTKINGVLIRPYPTQQQSGGMTASLGSATPPTSGVADFLEDGFIWTQIKAGQAVKKGDPCFIWCAAAAGGINQGQFTNAASAGNTAAVTNAVFWGPADKDGNVEVRVYAH